ncbi:retrotransposon protein, putative, ty1-copia subclass [Tanacetum coccineum]
MLQDVKSYLGRSFAMKYLGEAAYILGIKIYRDRSKLLIGLNQSAYIEKILKRFYMENSKRGTIPMQEKLKLSKSQGASTPVEKQRMQNIPYASAIGSIMYAVRCTRPDVAFAQNMTIRFQQNPSEEHWTAVKNILKYLRNTKDMFLVYGGNMKRQLRVSCYTDAGYLTDADNLKSQTGYVFVLNGGAVDWKSTKQSIFATSSTDAEYIAAFDASKEAVWIHKFISGLGIVPTIEEPISMYCGNTEAIAIAKDDGVTKGARHFRVKVHYLRETIKMGDVKIEKIDTDDNLADPFTKALAFPKHSELTRNIGLLPATKRCPETKKDKLDPRQIYEIMLAFLKGYALRWILISFVYLKYFYNENINMTTSVGNNSVFRSFFEKQKLIGPNFIDWYRQLRLVLSTEDKENYLEHLILEAPVAPPGQQVPPASAAAHAAWVKGQKEVVELKAMFSKQAEHELLQTVREFHACKQEEGQSVSSYVLKMKGYINNLERLGQSVGQNLAVSLILVSLNKDYDNFMQNYNMHGIGKTGNELHAMLKLHEYTLPKKDANPALHAI